METGHNPNICNPQHQLFNTFKYRIYSSNMLKSRDQLKGRYPPLESLAVWGTHPEWQQDRKSIPRLVRFEQIHDTLHEYFDKSLVIVQSSATTLAASLRISPKMALAHPEVLHMCGKCGNRGMQAAIEQQQEECWDG